MRHLILGLLLSVAITSHANAQVSKAVSGTCIVVSSSLMKSARNSDIQYLTNNSSAKLRVQKTHVAALRSACEDVAEMAAFHGPYAARQALTSLLIINGVINHRLDHSLLY